jgi:hypothetical protein
LDRRGLHSEAIELLESAAEDLKDRLVLARLKVRALQLRLMIKRHVPGGRRIALEAARLAHDHLLVHRAEELDGLSASVGR